jgi:hypothetical protein
MTTCIEIQRVTEYWVQAIFEPKKNMQEGGMNASRVGRKLMRG